MANKAPILADRRTTNTGDRVTHSIFGHGTVVSSNYNARTGAGTLVVTFDDWGTKALQWSFCAGKVTVLKRAKATPKARPKHERRSGFTLVEGMICMLIVAIVLAVVIPNLLANVHGSAGRYDVYPQGGGRYRTDEVVRLPDGGIAFRVNGEVIELHGTFRVIDHGAR